MVTLREDLIKLWQEREKEQKEAFDRMERLINTCEQEEGKGKTVAFIGMPHE